MLFDKKHKDCGAQIEHIDSKRDMHSNFFSSNNLIIFVQHADKSFIVMCPAIEDESACNLVRFTVRTVVYFNYLR